MPRGSKPKVYPAALVERVREMYERNCTQHEIATAVGLSQKVVWNVMRKHGLETRVAAKRDQRGEKNSYWKGRVAGYHAFHRRVYAKYGKPDCCLVCGSVNARNYDYANVSGRYEDVDDYVPLCRSCHWKYDGKVENITKRRDADGKAENA